MDQGNMFLGLLPYLLASHYLSFQAWDLGHSDP